MNEMQKKYESHEILLARIDERTRILNEMVTSLSLDIKNNYVTVEHFNAYKKEMKPVKQGFFAFISCVVFTVLITLLGEVLKK